MRRLVCCCVIVPLLSLTGATGCAALSPAITPTAVSVPTIAETASAPSPKGTVTTSIGLPSVTPTRQSTDFTMTPTSVPERQSPDPTAAVQPPVRAPEPTTEVQPPIGAEGVVELARADLARRLGLATEAIRLVSVEAVDWPDASLGCPRPGKLYAQVITPGYRLLLAVNDQTYWYHTDRQRNVVHCQATLAPSPVAGRPVVGLFLPSNQSLL